MTAHLSRYQQIDVLYREHQGWLLGWVRRKLGNAFDAADLVQEVFARLVARQQAMALREPRAYLTTVAHGLVVDHWRRRELEQAWLHTLEHLPEEQMPSPEKRLLLLQTLIEIDRMLDRLKPAVRVAFLHAQIDGWTCPQIAKHLGRSQATVERYLAQALRACYELRYASP